MNARRLLRSVSIVALLLAVGHTLGNPWTPAEDPAARAAVAAMRDYHFEIMGFRRSYFDFYVGFGWLLSAYLFGHASLYWQLASLIEATRSKLRVVVGILTIESIGVVLLSWNFLFWLPIAMNAVITLLLASAFHRLCLKEDGLRPTLTA